MGKLTLRLALCSCALVSFVACRSSTKTSLELGVDRAPPEESPSAIGGGPSSMRDDVYSQSSALNVLTSARCQRARTCDGLSDSSCEGEAAAAHGAELARCANGVYAAPLSDCAQTVRDAACGAAVAIPETCTASVLCTPE